MIKKLQSYRHITQKTEGFIRNEMELATKLKSEFDFGYQRHEATAAGAYGLWQVLTEGQQDEADDARLLALVYS